MLSLVVTTVSVVIGGSVDEGRLGVVIGGSVVGGGNVSTGMVRKYE